MVFGPKSFDEKERKKNKTKLKENQTENTKSFLQSSLNSQNFTWSENDSSGLLTKCP